MRGTCAILQQIGAIEEDRIEEAISKFTSLLRNAIKGAKAKLRHYRSYLQVDAAPAYDDVFAQHPAIIEVGCWAHARRYFKEGQTTERAYFYTCGCDACRLPLVWLLCQRWQTMYRERRRSAMELMRLMNLQRSARIRSATSSGVPSLPSSDIDRPRRTTTSFADGTTTTYCPLCPRAA